jgi:transcription initiation factor TFIIIB Brf1 subunit/transcription initiation factor TFIIB
MSRLPVRRVVGPGGCDCVSIEDQHLIEDSRSGDTICTTCACVVEAHMMDHRPEWYDESNARSEKRGRYDALLGSSGNIVENSKKRYAEPDVHKNVRLGLKQVEAFGATLNLDSEHQMCLSAKEFYRDYAFARKDQGRSIREVERPAAAACAIYFGCKSHERAGDRYPRSIKEISGLCGVPLQECTDLLKSYKSVLADKPYVKLLFTTVSGDGLLQRAINGLSPAPDAAERSRVTKRAMCIFDTIKSKDLLEGRTPETVCSAVLFYSCELEGVKVTKRMIYTACGVSNVTLNKALTELKSTM